VIEEIEEARNLGIAEQGHAPSPTGISSVRAAFRAKSLALKTDTAIPPFSGLNINFDVVNKSHGVDVRRRTLLVGNQEITMLTTVLFFPFFSYRTLPSVLAKRV
jgi:hypothetical protein